MVGGGGGGFESKILASAGSPIITQLVDLFFDGEPFYFATNLKKSFCSVFLSQGFEPPPPPPPIKNSWIRPCVFIQFNRWKVTSIFLFSTFVFKSLSRNLTRRSVFFFFEEHFCFLFLK